MQLSIEAIVFHRGDGDGGGGGCGVEVRKFNLLDRARFGTIPQLGELYERRLRRFKITRKLRPGPCGTRQKAITAVTVVAAENEPPPPAPSIGPVELFNAVARYRRRVSPCTSFNRTPHFSRRRITVSRSPAFCYATTALIHYSCAAGTRLAT